MTNRVKLITALLFIVLLPQSGIAKDVIITISLFGVRESTIRLLTVVGANTLKPLLAIDGVKNGEPAILRVHDNFLPGEFVLRFDYKIILSIPNTTRQLNESINV
jgi:hypothetical protein